MAEAKIIYPDLHGLEVQTLDREQTQACIPDLMIATGEAYVAEFSHNLGEVPADSIRRHYDPENAERLQTFTERTLEIHDRGSRLAVLFGNEARQEPRILGYTKMGPAQVLTRDDEYGRYADEHGRYSYNGYYFNNIVVHPGDAQRQTFWNRGFGSLLFHAGLTLPIGFEMPAREPGPINPESVVVLDVFTISRRVNAWYQKNGFRPDPDIPTGCAYFDDVAMPQMYYATPPSVLLKGVVKRLEAAKPALRNFTVIESHT